MSVRVIPSTFTCAVCVPPIRFDGMSSFGGPRDSCAWCCRRPSFGGSARRRQRAPAQRAWLIYKPQSFGVGRTVTIATLVVIAIVFIINSVHDRRRLRLE